MAARRQRAGGTGARRAMPNDGASSSSSSGGAIGSSRGGSGGRRTAPTPGCLPRLLILLAAAALLGRAAAAPFPPRCAMARCAKCQLLPAAYSAKNNRRPGLQRYCVKPAVGYATSADRRSVPYCAGGYAASFRGGPCRKCKKGKYAPRNNIGTKDWRSCQDCPENTAVNRRGSKCVANPGYYGNGLECPEDYYCALGAPWKCTQGSSTGGLTGQANCDFVAPGYYWENGMAVACPVDTFSAEARPKAEATSCDACSTGLSTNGGTASTSCGYILPGYYRSGSSAVPCPVDTALANVNQLFATAPTACPACPTGLNTNAATTQATCLWVNPGYFFNNSTALPCPVNTARPGNALAASTPSCPACATGFSTNGTTANTACNFIKAGFYNGGTATAPTAVPCAVNTASPADLTFAAAIGSCPNCTNGLTTGGLTGQTTCGFVNAGFYYNTTTGSAVQCPADQYAATSRPIASATSCLLCTALSAGLTTNGNLASLSCNYVQPGYGSTAINTAFLCPADTYADTIRLIPSASTCTACAPPGTTTNGTTGSTSLGACLAFIQAGYYNSPPPAVNPAQCMADTYQPFVRSISDPTIGSCTACNTGFTTNTTTGNKACSSLIKAGFLILTNTTLLTAAPCPTVTYFPSVRSVTGATSCLACTINTTNVNSTGCTVCPCP